MQPHVTPVAWTLLVPLKPLVRAKSRLAATAGDEVRPRLALAFAQDTVSAALACTAVRGVAVVTNDEHASAALSALGARVVPDAPSAGLNAALTHGATAIREQEPDAPVAALNADLPALKSGELAHVLNCAALFPRSFLSDAAGTGTTFLSALPAHALSPAFGGASRTRHLSSGATELMASGVDSVRQDVDTGADLRAATALGIGPFTARLLTPEQDGRTATELGAGHRRHPARRGVPAARTGTTPPPRSSRLPAMQATSYTYDPETRSGSVLLDDGTPLPFDAPAFDAGGLLRLRSGQRVRIQVEGEGEARRVTFITLQTL